MIKAKNKTAEVLKQLPETYSMLAGSKIELPTNTTGVIRCRVKNLSKKPALYIWDLTSNCYVSSLKPADQENKNFIFDIRHNETSDFYKLTLQDSSINIEALEG